MDAVLVAGMGFTPVIPLQFHNYSQNSIPWQLAFLQNCLPWSKEIDQQNFHIEQESGGKKFTKRTFIKSSFMNHLKKQQPASLQFNGSFLVQRELGEKHLSVLYLENLSSV